MSVQFRKHRVFRETPDVVFYDISVDDSNASDLVVHEGPAVSPPDDVIGAKQFYIHHHQVDHNRVLSGERTFELVNFEWKFPYHIVHLNRRSVCESRLRTFHFEQAQDAVRRTVYEPNGGHGKRLAVDARNSGEL